MLANWLFTCHYDVKKSAQRVPAEKPSEIDSVCQFKIKSNTITYNASVRIKDENICE